VRSRCNGVLTLCNPSETLLNAVLTLLNAVLKLLNAVLTLCNAILTTSGAKQGSIWDGTAKDISEGLPKQFWQIQAPIAESVPIPLIPHSPPSLSLSLSVCVCV